MTTTRETKELTTVDACRKLDKAAVRTGRKPRNRAVTRRGKPVLAIMTWEGYQSIMETLVMPSDDKALEQLSRSIKEVKEGRTVPWKDDKARLVT